MLWRFLLHSHPLLSCFHHCACLHTLNAFVWLQQPFCLPEHCYLSMNSWICDYIACSITCVEWVAILGPREWLRIISELERAEQSLTKLWLWQILQDCPNMEQSCSIHHKNGNCAILLFTDYTWSKYALGKSLILLYQIRRVVRTSPNKQEDAVQVLGWL